MALFGGSYGGEHTAAMTLVPHFASVDLCVVGGTVAGVAAALAAAEAGAKVLILAERTYLGDDVAGAFSLWAGSEPNHPLAQAIWPDAASPCTPLHAKSVLEQAAIAAGVGLLYAVGPTHVLRDATDQIAGVVVATSGGPLAITARIVLDATPRSLVAMLAGCVARVGGERPLSLVAIGERPDGALAVGSITGKIRGGETVTTGVWRLTRPLDLGAGTVRDWGRADAALRDAAFTPGQFRLGDLLEDATAGDAPEWLADRLALAPGNGLTPARRIVAGYGLGLVAIRRSRAMPEATPMHAYAAGARPVPGLRWLPTNQRFGRMPQLDLPGMEAMPDLGRWDVAVLGGGTGGAPAGLAAAGDGARTLVTEAAPGLGGVGTQGMIASYFDGNVVGFTRMIDAGVASMGPGGDALARHWNIEWKASWYLRQLRNLGAEVWFAARAVGCVRHEARIAGAVVTTAWGCGTIGCTVAVDATGCATLAAAAGSATSRVGADHVAMQGSGLSPRTLDGTGPNTDWTFVDDADPTDVTRVYAVARRKFPEAFDVAQMVDTRERRRIVSEHDLGALDILAQRTFPDTVCTAWSSFDTHGFTIHPAFMVLPPLESHDRYTAHIPLRSLLPRGLEGVLVTGLGMGAHRDAMPVVRMQADVQNTGAAAGLCAAWAARHHGGVVRDVPVRELQAALVALGNLKPEVARHQDSFPVTDAMLQEAVAQGLVDHRALAMVFAEAQRSRPLLQAALATAGDSAARVRLAQVLALQGEAAGLDILIDAITGSPWDAGWNYTGMCQFGRSTSHLDGLIIAVGRIGDRRAVAALSRKMLELDDSAAFSHIRSVAVAASAIGDATLVEPLARLLAQPGMAGHAHGNLQAAISSVDADGCATVDRNLALRELALARALWQLGDRDKAGEQCLRAYAEDVRGIFAAHAQAILAEPAGGAVRWGRERKLAIA